MNLTAAQLSSLGGAARPPAVPPGHHPVAGGQAVHPFRRDLDVHQAYKCRVRRPWWRVPYLKPADLLLTYMNADTLAWRPIRHAHIISTGARGVSAQRTAGRRDEPAAAGVAQFADPAGAELVGRPYGGGMLKIEPREADQLPVPAPALVRAHAAELRAIRPPCAGGLREGNLLGAAELVDDILLTGAMSMPAARLDSLRADHAHPSARRRARGRTTAGVPVAGEPSAKSRAWPLFDAIVTTADSRGRNPWTPDPGGDPRFRPDYATLESCWRCRCCWARRRSPGCPPRHRRVGGLRAAAAGLDPDAVWPREQAPRVVDRDVLRFIESLPKPQRAELIARLERGSVSSASANILGKNYLKQVDVLMTSWQTGPELLISTKRMDSSFGKNAANRVEGVLRRRQEPGAATSVGRVGFWCTACGRLPHAGALPLRLAGRSAHQTRPRGRRLRRVCTDRSRVEGIELPDEPDTVPEPEVPELFPELLAGPDPEDEPGLFELDLPAAPTEVAALVKAVPIDRLPTVRLRHDLVPDELSPARFSPRC